MAMLLRRLGQSRWENNVDFWPDLPGTRAGEACGPKQNQILQPFLLLGRKYFIV
jgi:hypothetical protein